MKFYCHVFLTSCYFLCYLQSGQGRSPVGIPTCLGNLCQATRCQHGAQCIVDLKTCRATCECSTFKCSNDRSPVCGTDEKTYTNQCHLSLSTCRTRGEVLLAHTGECKRQEVQTKSSFDVDISRGIVNKTIINGTYLNTSPNRQQQYDIINVEGYKADGDEGSVRLPQNCNQQFLNTSPWNLFCIDRQNGDIYATEQTTRTYVGGQTYNLTIQQRNETHSVSLAIQIRFNDACGSAGKRYFELSFKQQCSTFSLNTLKFRISTNGETSRDEYIFDTSKLKNNIKILGFKLDKSLFGRTTDSFEMVVLYGKKYIFGINIDSQHLNVPAYDLNEVKPGRSLVFRIQKRDPAGKETVIPIKPSNSVELVYFSTWKDCEDLTCVNKYKTWNSSISKATHAHCQKDESFFQTYYGRCTDLNPVFAGSPSIDGTSIVGCTYNSILPLDKYIYLLINGTKRIDGFKRKEIPRRKRAINEQLSQFHFPTFIISDGDAGEVLCGIFDPDRMKAPVLSNSTMVKYQAPVQYKWEVGFCVDSQGTDVDNGSHKLSNVPDAYSVETENNCQSTCLSYTKAKPTGCEYIWGQSNAGCYIHTNPIAKGNGVRRHKCSVFSETNKTCPDACKQFKCEFGAKCITNTACLPECDCLIVCDKTLEFPVCGSDGETYTNPCLLSQTICRSKVNTTTTYDGKCKKVSFTKDPPPIISINAGERLHIAGCSFNATFNLRRGEAVWLKYGKPYKNATIVNGKFGDIDIANATLADNGIYQCFIKAGALPKIRSDPSLVIIKGIEIEFINQITIHVSSQQIRGCQYKVVSGVADAASFLEFAYYELTNSQGVFKIKSNLSFAESTVAVIAPLEIGSVLDGGFKGYGEYKCVIFDPRRMHTPINSSSVKTDELLPYFRSGPSFQKTVYQIGEQLSLKENCIFETFFITGLEAYWVRNGIRHGNNVRYSAPFFQSAHGSPSTTPYVFESSNITVNESGSYGCALMIPGTISSPIMSKQTNITVTRADTAIIHIRNITSSSVVVAYSIPDSLVLLKSVTLELKATELKLIKTFLRPASENQTISIDNLKSGVVYTIRLRGIDTSGSESNLTPVKYFTTAGPKPVTSVNITVLSDTSVFIDWEPSDTIVDEYVIVIIGNNGVNSTIIVPGNDTSKTVNNLTGGTSYSVILFAVKDNIRSTTSQTFPITTSSSNIIRVQITGQPEILKVSGNQLIVTGCKYKIISGSVETTFQKHTYYELKNSQGTFKRLPTNDADFKQVNNYTIPPYTIMGFEDFGEYKCVVYDPKRMHAPVSSSSVNTDASLPRFITKEPVRSPQKLKYDVGDSLNLTCEVANIYGGNGITTYWIKDGKQLWSNATVSLSLRFGRLAVRDSGSYSCALSLSNVTSSPIISTSQVNITVIQLAAKFLSSPTWKVSSNKIEVVGCKYRSTTNLNKYAYWLFNDTERVLAEENNIKKKTLGNGLFEFETPSITILSFQKIGKYQCVIENQLLQGGKISSNVTNLQDVKDADILPTFIKHPKSNHGNITGGLLTIRGCQISSKIPLDKSVEIYYLKNGVEKINASSDPLIKSRENHFVKTLSFLPYSKPISEYTDQGFYQCVLKIPGKFAKQIVSKSTDVQFTDVAAAAVEVRMEKVWDERLNDFNSIEFKYLSQKVETDMVQNLPKQNGKKPIVRVLGFRKGSVISLTQVLYTNVSNDVRIKSCSTFQNIGKGVKLSPDLNVKSMTVKILDCCERSEFGEESFKGVEVFPESLVSVVRTNNCTYPNRQSSISQRRCVGNMKDGPTWSEVDSNDCPARTETTNNLISLSQVTFCSDSTSVNCQTPLEVTTNLSKIVSEPKKITTRQDLVYISNILHNISTNPTAFQPNDTESAEKVTINILQCVSTVIASDRRVVAQAQRGKQTSELILKSLDVIALRLGYLVQKTNKTIQIKKPNIALVVKYLEPKDIQVVGMETLEGTLGVGIYKAKKKSGKEERNNKGPKSEKENILSTFQVPSDAFQNSSNTVFSFLFRKDTLFQDNTQIKALEVGKSPVSSIMSNVLAITVGKTPVTNLSRPVSFTFKKIKNIKEEEDDHNKTLCTFWNPEFQTSIPNVRGMWMERGCEKVSESEDHVVCECNHLTNFAILLDVSQTGNNPVGLQIITWIGCGISLAGLALTLLTYMMFKKLRQKLPPKILMSLSFSLMVLLIVFLVGVERETVGSNEACQVVSGILHYFMLTTFMWMLVEAVNLYRNFVKIFRGGSDGKFFTKTSLLAWGVPLVIVVVNGAVKPGSLGNDRFCIVHGNSFYFGILLPVAAILLINFIVLVMVMRSLSKSKGSMMAGKEKSITQHARIAFACSALLGVTWVFALFAIGDLRDTFQWLFTIFNSLQGLFIFLFYTLRNQDVRTEWKRLFHIDEKGDEPTTTTSSQPNLTLSRNDLKIMKTNKKNSYSLDDQHSVNEIDLNSSSGNLIQLKQFRKQSFDMTKSSFKE